MEDTRLTPTDAATEASAGAKSGVGNTLAADVETLAAQLGEAERTIAALKDGMLRERADIENQRRRLQRELEQSRRFANEGLLRELLQVCDNLEHGLAADNASADVLHEGMQLTLKSLLKVVTDHGLTVVDPVDQPFDPERHQAMSMVASDELPPNTVVTVVQKGYLLNDRLLRPALVIVARAPAA